LAEREGFEPSIRF